MCPVVIAEKYRYVGSVTPSSLGVETPVVSISPQSDDYMVEGYLDLSPLDLGDTMVVSELISIDGAEPKVFTSVVYNGPLDEPIIRFHTKTLPASASYKVTVTQLSGTLRTIPYAFIVEVLGTI